MARPENYQELQRAAAESTPESASSRQNASSSILAAAMAAANQGGSDISSALSAASLVSLADGHIGNGLLSTPSRDTETRTDVTQNSLEHVRQDILTMHTLLSTMNIANDDMDIEDRRVSEDDNAIEEKQSKKLPTDEQDSSPGKETLDSTQEKRYQNDTSDNNASGSTNDTTLSSDGAIDGYNGQNKQFFIGQCYHHF